MWNAGDPKNTVIVIALLVFAAGAVVIFLSIDLIRQIARRAGGVSGTLRNVGGA
jgi:hypothetical protein